MENVISVGGYSQICEKVISSCRTRIPILFAIKGENSNNINQIHRRKQCIEKKYAEQNIKKRERYI